MKTICTKSIEAHKFNSQTQFPLTFHLALSVHSLFQYDGANIFIYLFRFLLSTELIFLISNEKKYITILAEKSLFHA